MSLAKYRQRWNFQISREPSGAPRPTGRARERRLYVVQKHRATQLHYDFRLEWNGVLLSWAVPKGPSLNPSVKRLAMQVEDHPREYADFEGVIPQGEYGGGTVMVWDQGEWSPDTEDVSAALRKGELKFTLHGRKLRGSWVLVRTGPYESKQTKPWLLIKHRDKYASERDITLEKPRSVLTKRLLADIARDEGGDVTKSATSDPKIPRRSEIRNSRRHPDRKKHHKSSQV